MIKRLMPTLNLRRIYVLSAVLAVFMALPASTAFADDEGASPTPVPDALTRDAQEYASDQGIGLQEAKRRLGLQGRIGQLDADLTTNEAGTFAGLWIQHGPEFRVIAKFTSDGEATVRPYVTGGPLAGIVEIQTADMTLEGLKAAQEAAMLAAGPLGVRVESEINVFENRVKLYVVERGRLDTALQNAGVQLPSKVDVVTVSQLSKPTADIHGGLELPRVNDPESICTSGFSVRHSDGTKGITTAGHCGNERTYSGTTLTFKGSRVGGSYDIQWHTAPGFTVRNWTYDGTGNRLISSTKNREQQANNEYVCKYGVTTGYGCGYIQTKNYLKTKFSSCPDCIGEATWIRVHRDGVDLSSEGDSGGPFFYGSTAYGTMSSRLDFDANDATPDDALYMAINYVSSSNLGLTVLTE